MKEEQSPKKPRKSGTFTHGIEKVVWLAALDRDFCQRLLTERKTALESCNVELTKTERIILEHIPEAQLISVIERISIPRPARRAFLRGAVATAFALMGTIVVSSGCTYGSQPDRYQEFTPPLKDIWMAQDKHKAEYGLYAKSLKELVDKDCLDKIYCDEAACGYSLEIVLATKDSFEATAISARNATQDTKRVFLIDQTGVIREIRK